MSRLRSETMVKGTLVLPLDRGKEFLTVLGFSTKVQITDMNANTMNRPYRKHIDRIDRMQSIISYLREEIDKKMTDKVEPCTVEDFIQICDYEMKVQGQTTLDSLEKKLNKFSEIVKRFRANNQDLLLQRNEAVEERSIVNAAIAGSQPNHDMYLSDKPRPKETYIPSTLDNGATRALLGVDGDLQEAGRTSEDVAMSFSTIAGCVRMSDVEKLNRSIFVLTRGNFYPVYYPIDDKIIDVNTEEEVVKVVYVLYYQGSSTGKLHHKIRQILDALDISTYNWPKSDSESRSKLHQLRESIEDKEKTIEALQNYVRGELALLTGPYDLSNYFMGSTIDVLSLFCQREKAIYSTLNLFEVVDITLRADCWFPASEESSIRQILYNLSSSEVVSAFLLCDRGLHTEKPPSYFINNDLTSSFQLVVNTYGIPRYKEINPAYFAVVMFPFLFGIMYGDIGHGLILTFTALWFIGSDLFNKNRRKSDSNDSFFHSARYMILMLGLHATYAGFLYNDFFSIGLNLFASRWKAQVNGDGVMEYIPSAKGPYPFGLDPIWKHAKNEVNFVNSFKMKFAVIIACLHTMTSIMVKGANAYYFGHYTEIIFETIPQFIFNMSFVGYMDFLIFYKWLSGPETPRPSIMDALVDMFRMNPPAAQNSFFKRQGLVQNALVYTMMLCIPIIFLGKPMANIYFAKKKFRNEQFKAIPMTDEVTRNHPDPVESDSSIEPDDKEEAQELSEICIEQLIETLEFLLGTISNTASYLRLWALSLAHQQLSAVFFEKTILAALTLQGSYYVTIIALFIATIMFTLITFVIMVGLDSMECFLHTTRLQWVEFQNRFFKGDGYEFSPFDIRKALGKDKEY